MSIANDFIIMVNAGLVTCSFTQECDGVSMLDSYRTYQSIQIIQWQLTTRLVGVQRTQDFFMAEDAWPALITRDHGFNNFEDSSAVYALLEQAQNRHPELRNCDAISRLLSLYDVMSAAALHANNNELVLKVFIAPDGYFTNSNTGVYSLVQTRLIKHLLQSVIGSQPRFNNWLIIPGTIKWKNEDSPFSEQSNVLLPMTSVNSSAVILYRGRLPLLMGDGKLLNDACFFIEPLSDLPPMLPLSPWGEDLYVSQRERRELELQRHLFSIGTLSIGIEINQEQEGAAAEKNCLSQALASKGEGQKTLDLQILLSSHQLLDSNALNIHNGGVATMLNGLVGLTREPAPVAYQLYQSENNEKEIMLKNDDFLRKNFLLPPPLQLTGIPSKGYCASEFGGEETLHYNYDLGLLRIFKPLQVKQDCNENEKKH
jgi:hypothetical protein